jgi:hypothetical protein
MPVATEIQIRGCRCRVNYDSSEVPLVKFVRNHPDGNFCLATACGHEVVPSEANSYKGLERFEEMVVGKEECPVTAENMSLLKRRRSPCPRGLIQGDAGLAISKTLFNE